MFAVLVDVEHVLDLPCFVFFVALDDAHAIDPEKLAVHCGYAFTCSDEYIDRYWVCTDGAFDAHSFRIERLNVLVVGSSPYVRQRHVALNWQSIKFDDSKFFTGCKTGSIDEAEFLVRNLRPRYRSF
jgi:hypothetical protein